LEELRKNIERRIPLGAGAFNRKVTAAHARVQVNGAGTAVLVQRLRRTALCWDFLRIFISKLSCCSFSVVNVVLPMTDPLAGNMITEM
jgi:hypothetical protein